LIILALSKVCRTVAKKDGDFYIVDGNKKWITNGVSLSDVYKLNTDKSFLASRRNTFTNSCSFM
jgi:hypothetical protein